MSLFLFFSLGQRSVLAPPLPICKSRVQDKEKSLCLGALFLENKSIPEGNSKTRATQLLRFNCYTPGELTRGGAFLVKLSPQPKVVLLCPRGGGLSEGSQGPRSLAVLSLRKPSKCPQRTRNNLVLSGWAQLK